MIYMMSRMRKIVDRVIEAFAVITLSSMVILTTYQVITRYFFNNPSVYSEVLAKYLFIWLVLIVGAYVIGKRDHMSIVFIKEKFNENVQNILNLLIDVIVLIFAVIVLGYGGYLNSVTQFSQTDSILPVSAGFIYLALPISAVLIMFYSVCNIIDDIAFFTNKRGVK